MDMETKLVMGWEFAKWQLHTNTWSQPSSDVPPVVRQQLRRLYWTWPSRYGLKVGRPKGRILNEFQIAWAFYNHFVNVGNVTYDDLRGYRSGGQKIWTVLDGQRPKHTGLWPKDVSSYYSGLEYLLGLGLIRVGGALGQLPKVFSSTGLNWWLTAKRSEVNMALVKGYKMLSNRTTCSARRMEPWLQNLLVKTEILVPKDLKVRKLVMNPTICHCVDDRSPAFCEDLTLIQYAFTRWAVDSLYAAARSYTAPMLVRYLDWPARFELMA